MSYAIGGIPLNFVAQNVQIIKNLMALILNHITKEREESFRISST